VSKTIRDVVNQTGLSTHTLRYYENAALIPPVKRADNGHRIYQEEDLGWIDFVKRFRETGMPIANMGISLYPPNIVYFNNSSRVQLIKFCIISKP
jgi:DNA-binding transcriptional MerR regulator